MTRTIAAIRRDLDKRGEGVIDLRSAEAWLRLYKAEKAAKTIHTEKDAEK